MSSFPRPAKEPHDGVSLTFTADPPEPLLHLGSTGHAQALLYFRLGGRAHQH